MQAMNQVHRNVEIAGCVQEGGGYSGITWRGSGSALQFSTGGTVVAMKIAQLGSSGFSAVSCEKEDVILGPVKIEDCILMSQSGDGVCVEGNAPAAVEVKRCRIVQCEFSGVSVSDGGEARIEDSLIVGCGEYGINGVGKGTTVAMLNNICKGNRVGPVRVSQGAKEALIRNPSGATV